MTIRSFDDIKNLYIAELQNNRPDITDTEEGSVVDAMASATALAVSEVNRLTVEEFSKTFFDSANGPEVTGGPDDLQTLAVDHFGDSFERPAGIQATGTVTFTRPTTTAGDVTIAIGTVVTTEKNADGVSTRFMTTTAATMTGLTASADIEADLAGVDGNVDPATIVLIETTLTDSSVTVSNVSATAGGADEQTDDEYRETIKNGILALKGAVASAIEAAAKTAEGVVYASAYEIEKPVIEYDIATNAIKAGAFFFRIPYAVVYVADEDGNGSTTLEDNARAAIDEVRALGVYITVASATASTLNWTLDIVLNPSGPNFAALSADTELIRDSMDEYIQNIAIGSGFDVSDATAAMLVIWGPAGTNDITSSISTSVPAADIAGATGIKLVPGTLIAS